MARSPGPPRWLLKLTKAIVLWGVAQPWGHRFVVGPAWGWVLVFYALARPGALSPRTAMARLRIPQPARAAGRAPWWLLVAWVVPGWLFAGSRTMPDAALEAEFLAVGHGLAVVIQTPDGQTCSTTAAGWAIRPSAAGSSRRRSGRAESAGSTPSS